MTLTPHPRSRSHLFARSSPYLDLCVMALHVSSERLREKAKKRQPCAQAYRTEGMLKSSRS